jgi:hypothetical protein
MIIPRNDLTLPDPDESERLNSVSTDYLRFDGRIF